MAISNFANLFNCQTVQGPKMWHCCRKWGPSDLLEMMATSHGAFHKVMGRTPRKYHLDHYSSMISGSPHFRKPQESSIYGSITDAKMTNHRHPTRRQLWVCAGGSSAKKNYQACLQAVRRLSHLQRSAALCWAGLGDAVSFKILKTYHTGHWSGSNKFQHMNLVCIYVICIYVCMVWYGMVWYGKVWYGMVWHGMVCNVM